MAHKSGDGRVRLSRVILRNYKSIGYCDVALQPLTILVGPNGAGKSNFLDALRLTADALRSTLEHALRERGGIKEVRRRSRGHPTHFEIQMEWELADRSTARYGFRVGALQNGGFRIQKENCLIVPPHGGIASSTFQVEEGKLKKGSSGLAAVVEPDRLYLTAVSGLPEFRALYDAITGMGFYNLNPEKIRDLQSPDAGEILARDGSNLASVVSRLESLDEVSWIRVQEYIARVVPGVASAEAKSLGHKETIEFRQQVAGDENPWRFLAANMSDGTLRAFGILVALHQRVGPRGKPASLIGIEEPEVALHPGAAAALSDALIEASQFVQVLATSHSPDLLDNSELEPEAILAVVSASGQTHIAPLEKNTRESLRKHLYSPGELLRVGQLEPDPTAIKKAPRQMTLFPDMEEPE